MTPFDAAELGRMLNRLAKTDPTARAALARCRVGLREAEERMAASAAAIRARAEAASRQQLDALPAMSDDALLHLTSKIFDVTIEEMVDDTLRRHKVRARWCFAYLAMTRLGRSSVGAGAAIRKDHSSILNARRRVQEMFDTGSDPVFTENVERVWREMVSHRDRLKDQHAKAA